MPRLRPEHTLTYPLTIDALKALQLLQGNDYNIASRLKMNRALSQQIETLMRNYLKYLLEREVKSAVWLDTLREQTREIGV